MCRSSSLMRIYLLILWTVIGAGGCVVKHTVHVPVPQKMLAAKTATLSELLTALSEYCDNIVSLSSGSLRVTFTSGRVESGKLQAYRSAPGYILLKRPDSIRLNIQNPITKTALIELQSVEDRFSLWYPRDNKFFFGKNSTREFELEGHPTFTARPSHIFEAILPQKPEFSDSSIRINLVEEQDAVTKYYVIGIFRDLDGRELKTVRRLWVDRSNLAVARQQTYDEEGRLVSQVSYGRLMPVEAIPLPMSIRIERPVDGYSLDLEFASWRLNPGLQESDFMLSPPPGAELVELKEKERNGKP